MSKLAKYGRAEKCASVVVENVRSKQKEEIKDFETLQPLLQRWLW